MKPPPPFCLLWRTLSLVVFLLGIGLPTLQAQNPCTDKLRRAEIVYFPTGPNLNPGLTISEIPELLSPCLSEYKNAEKQRALVILSFVYLQLRESDNYQKYNRLAYSTFLNLLRNDPEFPIEEYPRFRDLYDSCRTEPVFMIQGMMGVNNTAVQVLQSYGVDNTQQTSPTYTSQLGFQLALGMDIPVIKRMPRLLPGIEMSVMNLEYDYSQELSTSSLPSFNFTQLNFKETQWHVGLSGKLTYHLGDQKWIPYIYAGGGPQFLFRANFLQLNRTIDETLEGNSDLSVLNPQDVSVTSQRNRININVFVGAGLKLKTGINYWVLDVRLGTFLQNMTNGDSRYSTRELNYLYGYVDNDFRLNYGTVSLGYYWRIFNPKKL